nr:hypothetical protein [Lachnospiraceae bacterium]
MRKNSLGIVLALAGSLLFSDIVTAGVVPEVADTALADEVSEAAPMIVDDGSEAAVKAADDGSEAAVKAADDAFTDAFDFLYEDRGRFLTEQNRIVYDRLKVFANEVAESKHDTAVLELAPADLGLDTEYALSDLGVTAFKEGEGLSEETLSALKGKVSVDLQSVTCSLVADDPLAFFWYDSDHKDTEEQWDAASITCEFTGTVSDDGELLTLDDASVIRIGLMVLPEYSSAKEAGTTAVDKTETAVFKSSLEKAKSKANTIKSSAPSGASDRDRLEYYMTQICALVEYDKDASGSAAVQMANIFNSDGTAVASGAGYAAAFRYLCDITSFKSAWISAIVVEGTVKVDGGADQSHVWNLVQMNDGKGLYLVDTALCDTAAGNGELFLTGTAFDKGEGGYRFETNEKTRAVVYKYDNPVAEPYNPDELKLAEIAYVYDENSLMAEPGKQVMGVNLASPDTKTKDLNYRLGMDVPKPVTVTVTPADAANPD